jgi:uncharacterized protein (DUF1800 family)
MATTAALVAHIWRRLGFGATRADLDAGIAAGPGAVVADLLARPPVVPTADQPDPWGFPTTTDYTGTDQFALRMIELMAFGPSPIASAQTAPTYNPLQERMAWILHGLVVIAVVDVVYDADMRDHVRLVRSRTHGSYAQLLTDVSTRPGMLKYLTGYTNTRTHPNQNFSRELMELFSLGRLNARTGEPNYGEQDVREIARAMTGWRYNWNSGGTFFDAGYWDPGAKVFRGQSLGAAKLPEVIAALQAHPAWPYHVSGRIYRELTGLPATPEVLDALAPAFGTTGDLAALVSIITARPEFLSDAAIYSRVKGPVELIASAARLLGYGALNANSGSLGWRLRLLGQHPYFAPNVSGWYKGDQWLNATNVLTWTTVANEMAMRGFNWAGNEVGPINPAVDAVFATASQSTAADAVLAHCALVDPSPTTRSALTTYAAAGSWSKARVAGLFNLALVAPEFLAY